MQGGVHLSASTPITIAVIKTATPTAIRIHFNIFTAPVLYNLTTIYIGTNSKVLYNQCQTALALVPKCCKNTTKKEQKRLDKHPKPLYNSI
jgi:hypothetical protein